MPDILFTARQFLAERLRIRREQVPEATAIVASKTCVKTIIERPDMEAPNEAVLG